MSGQIDEVAFAVMLQALPWIVCSAILAVANLALIIVVWRSITSFRKYQKEVNALIDSYQFNAQTKLDQLDLYAQDAQKKIDTLLGGIQLGALAQDIDQKLDTLLNHFEDATDLGRR